PGCPLFVGGCSRPPPTAKPWPAPNDRGSGILGADDRRTLQRTKRRATRKLKSSPVGARHTPAPERRPLQSSFNSWRRFKKVGYDRPKVFAASIRLPSIRSSTNRA